MQGARVCAWNVDGRYKSASVVVTRAGGWWVGACVLLALGHWCCLAASHHSPSPSLSRSTPVARPLPRYRGPWKKQQLSQQPLSKVS